MRRIDHIVVAVRELDQAADLYRRVGFQVGARNEHPWGTENRLIQFGSSFIELISLGGSAHRIAPHHPRQFSFGTFVRNYLELREGIAMLVLSSSNAESDAAEFAARGIGDFEPFFFERRGKGPGGSETQVAFTLAFACDPAAPNVGFFVCQQHFPENFWNRIFQEHPNSARDIAAVTLAAPDPMQHVDFLAGFSGAEGHPLPDGGLRFGLGKGRIEIIQTAELQSQALPSTRLRSCTVQVGELESVERILEAEKIPFAILGDRIVVPSESLFGMELYFEMNSGV